MACEPVHEEADDQASEHTRDPHRIGVTNVAAVLIVLVQAGLIVLYGQQIMRSELHDQLSGGLILRVERVQSHQGRTRGCDGAGAREWPSDRNREAVRRCWCG